MLDFEREDPEDRGRCLDRGPEREGICPRTSRRVPDQDPSQSCWKGAGPPLTHGSLSLPVGSEPQPCSPLKPVRPEIAGENKTKQTPPVNNRQCE